MDTGKLRQRLYAPATKTRAMMYVDCTCTDISCIEYLSEKF